MSKDEIAEGTHSPQQHTRYFVTVTVVSVAYRAQVKEMTALYPALVLLLACGASAFFSPSTMPPVRAGIGFQRTAAILGSSSGRLLRGGSSSVATRMSSSSSEHFDYLVIGGGSGGVSSARRAATYDVKVGVSRWVLLGAPYTYGTTA